MYLNLFHVSQFGRKMIEYGFSGRDVGNIHFTSSRSTPPEIFCSEIERDRERERE